MAGAKITITVDDAQVQAMFARLMAFGEDAVADAGRDIGEYMLRSTRERSAREQSPDGVPWVALSPKYAARKQRKRPGVGLLHFDDFMLGARLSYQARPDFLWRTSPRLPITKWPKSVSSPTPHFIAWRLLKAPLGPASSSP
ncbi:MAG TPA: phage virion morphogenesis protein [Rudaea sp.]|nr:phage virion morphogenesis protein [Rudaea sp.]